MQTLAVSEGNLVMQDAQTAQAILEPLKSFGTSAFGTLRFRAISEEGRKGDWLPLATPGAAAGAERDPLPGQP